MLPRTGLLTRAWEHFDDGLRRRRAPARHALRPHTPAPPPATPRCRSGAAAAAGVSEAGSGGQVLMEQESFAGIRDMMHELGAIDANGLNYRCEGGDRVG